MRVRCTAVIDNPGEMAKFVRKMEGLGFKPEVVGDTVYVEYIGYNQTKYNLLIDIFEDRTRHTIDTKRL